MSGPRRAPRRGARRLAALLLPALLAAGCGGGGSQSAGSTARSAPPSSTGAAPGHVVAPPAGAALLPGRVPPLLAADDVYAATRPGMLAPQVRGDPALVYVPNSDSNTVDVISQRTGKVVEHFATGALPQHVTPSWDLRTLYVTNDLGNSLTPIDPRTGRPGRPIAVRDPYNLYFTPDGTRAIVVAEAMRLAGLPRRPDACAWSTRCRCPSARESTTWTSPPTVAWRSSRASSPADWSWSTCSGSAP